MEIKENPVERTNMLLDRLDHDIVIGSGVLRVGGKAYTAQLVKCRLLTLFGEWGPEPALGIPWVRFLSDAEDEVEIYEAIEDCVANTPNVVSVKNIDVSSKNRQLSASMEISTIYGEIKEDVTWHL